MLAPLHKDPSATNTYLENHATTFSINSGIWWGIFGVLSLITENYAKKYLSQSRKNDIENYYKLSLPSDGEELLDYDSMHDQIIQKKSSGKSQTLFTENDKKNRILRYLNSLFSWLSWLSISSIPAWLSGFDVISLSFGIFSSVAILLLRLYLSLYYNCPVIVIEETRGITRYQKVLTSMITLHPRKIAAGLACVFLAGLFMNMLTYKSCFNEHVDATFEPIFYGGKYIYSSAFTRRLYLDKTCPPGPPCQLYATLPFDTATSVFLNVHTHTDIRTITVNFDTEEVYKTNGKLGQKAQSSYYISPPGYDSVGERNIHNILLTDLTPDTKYIIEIFYDGKTQKQTSYQTLPSKESQANFNLIYGGDIGFSKAAQDLSILAAEKDPRVLIIGGDLAYDDGHASCYHTLDKAMSMLQSLVNDKLKRLVPLLIAVGNHDVGWKSLATVDKTTNENGPSYFTGYPQHLPPDGLCQSIRVPEVNERMTYHAHMLGKVLNVVLDSGYSMHYGGEQLTWLEKISEEYQQYPKIAIYHNPLVMPCGDEADRKSAEVGAEIWRPVFDKYKYMTAFEHHTHYFKRSYAILADGTRSEEGVLYLGSGAWGVKPDECEGKFDLFESVATINHIWIATVNQAANTIHYEVIGKNGTIDTPFTVNLR